MSKPVAHDPISFRFPSRGVKCGAKGYSLVTSDPKQVTCKRCLAKVLKKVIDALGELSRYNYTEKKR